MFTANATTTAGLGQAGQLIGDIAPQAIVIVVGLISATFVYALVRRAIKKAASKVSKL